MRCLIVPGLPFLAVGMGMPLRRKATMRGLAAGFAIYILFLKGIDFLAAAGMVSAGPAIWSLGAFFLGLAGLLYRATIRGHPLAVPALALSLPSFFAVRPKFFASKVKDLEKAAL
jgi:hypothetical protein